MDELIKSVETPVEAIELFNQLQPLLTKHEFEFKKMISNSEKSSALGLQWNVTESPGLRRY